MQQMVYSQGCPIVLHGPRQEILALELCPMGDLYVCERDKNWDKKFLRKGFINCEMVFFSPFWYKPYFLLHRGVILTRECKWTNVMINGRV